MGKSIGKGQFGEVYGGLNMNTGEYVAIKRIRRNDMECDDMVILIDYLFWFKTNKGVCTYFRKK
jgi:serine/threonine protein kinase